MSCCGGQAQKQGQGRRVASPEVVSSGRGHSGRRGQPPAGDLCKAGRGHLPRTEKGFAHQRSSPVVKGGRRGVNSITRPVTRLGLCRRRGWGHRAESQRHHGPGAQNREGGRWAAGRARVGPRRHAAGCHRKRCHKRSGTGRVWGRAVCAAVRLALARNQTGGTQGWVFPELAFPSCLGNSPSTLKVSGPAPMDAQQTDEGKWSWACGWVGGW